MRRGLAFTRVACSGLPKEALQPLRKINEPNIASKFNALGLTETIHRGSCVELGSLR